MTTRNNGEVNDTSNKIEKYFTSLSNRNIAKIVRVALILNIIFIVLTDTSALHKLPILRLNVWSAVISVILFPAVIFVYKQVKDPINFGLAIFSYILGLFNIFSISSSNTLLQVTLMISNLIFSYVIYREYKKRKDFFLLLYFSLTVTISFDLLFQSLSLSSIYLSLFYEVLILLAILLALPKYNSIDVLIILVTSVIGGFLALFILQFPLPITIVRTLISQTLGINSGSILTISSNTFFVLHLSQIFAISTALLLKKKYQYLFLLASGISLNFVPLFFIRQLLFYETLNS